MLRSAMALGAALALAVMPASAIVAQDDLQPPDTAVESRMLDAGSEPLVDLAYDWVEGQTELTTLELWNARSSHFGELAMEEHPPIPFRLEVAAEVQHVDSDGTALVELRIEDVALLEPAAGADAETLLADLQTLVGVLVREEYDTKGHVLAEQLVDPLEDADDLHPARSTALSTVQGLPLRLPPEPVGIGGTWEEVVTSTEVPAGTETLTKRLVEIDRDGGYRIEVSTLVDIPRQEAPGDELGLDEPVQLYGEGSATQDSRGAVTRILPVWTGTYEGGIAIEAPLGTLVTVTMDTVAGVSGAPPDWADPAWPALPPIDDSLLSTEPTPIERADDASSPGLIDVVVLDPGVEPRQELRYRLREGQVEHTAMVMRMGMRTKLDGEWTGWLGMPATEIAGTTTVTGVRDDGTYDIETVFTDVSVPDAGQLPPDAMAELEAELAGMIGLRQLLHMDDRGRILAAETVVPPGVSTGAVQPAQLDAMVQDFIDPLPQEAVGVGAEWEVGRQTSDAMGFATTGSNRLTLVELLPDGRLTLEGVIAMSAQPGPFVIPDMAFVDATIDRFSMDGGMSKTVDLGLVNPEGGSEAISDYAFSISFGDTIETTEMQMGAEFESRLVAVEDGSE